MANANPIAPTPSQPLLTYIVKSPKQIHDDWIRTVKNGLIKIGVAAPNVGPNSDYDVTATAWSNELSVVQANSVILADQSMPDTATGPNLDRWLNIVGLSRRPAIGSSGNVTINTSISSTQVTTAMQLTDSAGLRYQVAVGGNYGPATTTQVPIAAIDTGQATNHNNGDTLTWVTAPAFSDSKVTVGLPGGSDGLTGGADSEVGVDEPPRGRLLSLFQQPPKGGNSVHIALWATQATPVVQAAFVYPALLGPANVFFVVCAQPQTIGPFSSNSKSRALSSVLVTNTVVPFVQGLLPEHVFCLGVSSVDQPTDVALLLSLPSAPTASPPGPGGGWIDGTPWPQSISGTTPVTVTGVTNSTQFTVNASTSPTVGVTHIAWLSPLTWTITQAIVTAVSGSSGAYTITIDTPMPGITNGNYIFPASVNQQNYVNAMFQAFSTMGPGEWLTAGSGGLARGFRHPVPAFAWPYSLGAPFLKQVINSGPEVLDANFIFRSATTPTTPGVPVVNSSGILTSAAPNILTPRNFAVYAA